MLFRPPLIFRFKLIALASQIFVEDARGKTLLHARQKMLKLKEDIVINGGIADGALAYRIQADRWLDFNAEYSFMNHHAKRVGSVRRLGMRSLWKAHYEVMDDFGRQAFTIEQESALVAFINGLLEQIPIIDFLSGYVLNPVYLVKDASGRTVMKHYKRPALWEGRYELLEETTVPEAEREIIVLALIMMTLLERQRG
jgi:uncharacterized protein YxjI